MTTQTKTSEKKARARCKVAGCLKSRAPGLSVCVQHGGGWPQARRVSELALLDEQMTASGLVQPIPMDDPRSANPAQAIHDDYRRTCGRIDWLEQQIAQMSLEELQWSRSRFEVTSVGEFPGSTETWESRIPVFEDMLSRERAHLLKLVDLMGRQHFASAELALKQHAAEVSGRYIYDVLVKTVDALGLDSNNLKIRATMTEVLQQAWEEEES